jgi:hypothetical protein
MLTTQHERLEKLRREIFKRRTPQQCFIAQESEIYRGLEFELHFPSRSQQHWIEITHWEGDRYWLVASFNSVDRPLARYTRLSLTVSFEDLEQWFLRCIGMMLKESRPL